MFNTENAVKLALFLVSHLESFRAVAYQDGAGVWTFGFGTTTINGNPVREHMTCTEEAARNWLSERLTSDCRKLAEFCETHSVDLTDNQAAALLSFIYNAGYRGFLGSSMANDLIDGNTDKVTSDLLKWNKIRIDERLVFSAGLFNRRMAEEKCFMDETMCG